MVVGSSGHPLWPMMRRRRRRPEQLSTCTSSLPQRLRSGANAAQVVQRVLVLAALGQVCVRFSLLATSPSSGLRACLPAPSTSPRLPPRVRVRDRLRCRPDSLSALHPYQGPTLRAVQALELGLQPA